MVQNKHYYLSCLNGVHSRYFEEEAIISYSLYLKEIDNGTIENVPAPKVAIEYWRLPLDATLREVVIAVRNDEAGHRDANHNFANNLRNKSNLSIGFGNLKQRIKKRLKRKF